MTTPFIVAAVLVGFAAIGLAAKGKVSEKFVGWLCLAIAFFGFSINWFVGNTDATIVWAFLVGSSTERLSNK